MESEAEVVGEPAVLKIGVATTYSCHQPDGSER